MHIVEERPVPNYAIHNCSCSATYNLIVALYSISSGCVSATGLITLCVCLDISINRLQYNYAVQTSMFPPVNLL